MKTIREQVDEKMDQNQALKAWDLVKDTDDGELKTAVWAKVRHAFDEKVYREYYEKELIEYPVPSEIVFDCTQLNPRFQWLLPKLIQSGASSVLDIGCADGYLGLTLGKWGIPSVGLNLYEPSVKLARMRAQMNHTPAKFEHMDFRDYTEKHDAVVFFEILEHLPDPAKAIEKAYSLVKDGGRLYISTPIAEKHKGIAEHLAEKDRKSWDDGKISGHLFLLSEQELKDLLKPYHINEFHIDDEYCQQVEIQK